MSIAFSHTTPPPAVIRPAIAPRAAQSPKAARLARKVREIVSEFERLRADLVPLAAEWKDRAECLPDPGCRSKAAIAKRVAFADWCDASYFPAYWAAKGLWSRLGDVLARAGFNAVILDGRYLQPDRLVPEEDDIDDDFAFGRFPVARILNLDAPPAVEGGGR